MASAFSSFEASARDDALEGVGAYYAWALIGKLRVTGKKCIVPMSQGYNGVEPGSLAAQLAGVCQPNRKCP
eukprot:1142150-Pelagomonas_calceolata.AAC.2